MLKSRKSGVAPGTAGTEPKSCTPQGCKYSAPLGSVVHWDDPENYPENFFSAQATRFCAQTTHLCSMLGKLGVSLPGGFPRNGVFSGCKTFNIKKFFLQRYLCRGGQNLPQSGGTPILIRFRCSASAQFFPVTRKSRQICVATTKIRLDLLGAGTIGHVPNSEIESK